MKKILSILICTAMLLFIGAVPAVALLINAPFEVDGTSVQSLAEAFEKAENTGSVIRQNGKTADLQEIKSGIEVTKNVTLSLGKDDFNPKVNRISYTGENAPLFTVADGGVLTVKYSVLYGNSNAVNTYGGLFRVEKGGTLILDGTANEPVVISGCELKAQNAKGGAIYCEQGGKVLINGASFAGNSAAYGNDIYAEQKTDITLAEGVKVNAAYGESVEINALNLVLTGEIGLVFHTAVPDRYLNGSFVLTSRTGEPVTCKITDCAKDNDGRYLAPYNLRAIELSEPVTLTVCDENGDEITSKTKSAEEYGAALLQDETVPEKEKAVAATLLNYGHFAQIECAAYEGWEIGKDYAESAKIADLTVSDSAFAGFAILHTGDAPRVGIQLKLGYKTDLCLHFAAGSPLPVTVNGAEAVTVPSAASGFETTLCIAGIGALDLADEFTVAFENGATLTLSALSFGRLAIRSGSENCKNAVRALYEFYLATQAYHCGSF